MTEKIVNLVKQSVEKARMESELETARNVQQRFIPNPDFESSQVKIRGLYEPASECGGDWWFYLNDGKICTMVIGDVTGHGVASALITSALRAGVSALQNIGNLSLADYVANLNKVIHDSGQGNIMVTFFIARLDLETGNLNYVNASHCPPVIIPHDFKENGEYIFLDEIGGRRLGDDPQATYESRTQKLGPRDILFCFTDGLHEFENSEGKMYGERRMMKVLKKSAEASAELGVFRAQTLKDFKEFQKQDVLSDDLTFFFIEYKGAQEQNAPEIQAEAV
jgi:sigma-B regulation protein RsbU (phosphoserine phosphatase)